MPKTINEMPLRIILFYVLAIIAVLMVITWNQVSTSSSPFVQALAATGIKNTGSFINLVVISAGVFILQHDLVQLRPLVILNLL